MKRIAMLLVLCILSGCLDKNSAHTTPSYTTLGATHADHVWVYLCGIASTIDAEKNDNHRILNALGKRLGITFLAITPQHRYAQQDSQSHLHNKLYWPGSIDGNEKEILHTYQEIKKAIGTHHIDGYIGFSNGGYFLNHLAHYVEFNKPIITIAAATRLFGQGKDNTLYALIGTQDHYNYDNAKKMYAHAQLSKFKITLLEYEGGHVMPEALLENVLASLYAQH